MCGANRDKGDHNQLWLVDVGTKRWERLTDATAFDSHPTWAPNGRRIAFSSTRSGSEDVWTLEVGSGKLTQLTNAPGRDYAPAWSPDGTRIAFVAGRVISFRDTIPARPDLDVWLMHPDGSDQRQVTSNQGSDRCVAWSPDGKRLVYSASRRGGVAERLLVRSLNGSRPTALPLDRAPREAEIQAAAEPVGLFMLLPSSAARMLYPESRFGSETFPAWIA